MTRNKKTAKPYLKMRKLGLIITGLAIEPLEILSSSKIPNEFPKKVSTQYLIVYNESLKVI